MEHLPIPPPTSKLIPKNETIISSNIKPIRAILQPKDLESFKNSKCCKEIQEFVQGCADSVVGYRCTDSFEIPSIVTEIENFMIILYNLIDEIPPIKQPMRFGNKAFRTWHARLKVESKIFVEKILTREMIDSGVGIEIEEYLFISFGNETRIDYGTGHELSIVIFFLCLLKLKLISKTDLRSLVLISFASYIRTMRRLQETYQLEPAGSHGVWGLDDYHCLTFLWGSAQLCNHESIKPSSIHDVNILKEESSSYLYLEGISFIRKIKSCAPFSETSPMLNDISGIGEWSKVCNGLMRLFEGEVLFKFPVVQHLLFGSLIVCSWQPSYDGRDSGIGIKIFDGVNNL